MAQERAQRRAPPDVVQEQLRDLRSFEYRAISGVSFVWVIVVMEVGC